MKKPKNIIVHCQTKEDWGKVQNIAFSYGVGWMDGDTRYFDGWNEYENTTSIAFLPEDDNKMSYGPIDKILQKYHEATVMSAQLFYDTWGKKPVVSNRTLEEIEKTILKNFWALCTKTSYTPNQKPMNMWEKLSTQVKKQFKPYKEQLLYGLRESDLSLTADAKDALLQAYAETAEGKAALDEVIKQRKAEEKDEK